MKDIEKFFKGLRAGENWPDTPQGNTMDDVEKEHDPIKCGCEYRGNDMWSCGHIDNNTNKEIHYESN